MKKNILIPLCVIVVFLFGFFSGKSHSSGMNSSYEGIYAEKQLPNEKDPFLLEIAEQYYEYSDPESDKNGKGSYEVMDEGIIRFTSGDLNDVLAVSKKRFMSVTSLTLYNACTGKKIELVKTEQRQ